MLETLTTLFQPWADVYSASAVLPTAVIAVHLLAILGGGGLAIAADRQVLRATPASTSDLHTTAEELRSTHGVVIGSLVVIIVSGIALATADVGTFAVSQVFWMKMATFAGLLANGTVMRRMEARSLALARAAADDAMEAPLAPLAVRAWTALRRTAWISLTGWFVVMFLGVVVANI